MSGCKCVSAARPTVAFVLIAAAWAGGGCGALIGVDPGEPLAADAGPPTATFEESGSPEPQASLPANEAAAQPPATTEAAGDDAASLAGSRLRREWTPSLLALVLALGVGETLLAWWCGRPV